jgi:hypothetical protein
MGELVVWLRAQLNEDERIARSAGLASWQNLDMDGELRDDVNAGTVAYTPRVETRAHIARHDPARVLREIDAKRQILRAVEDAEVALRNTELGAELHELMSGSANSLRAVMQMLALPYADRPGYRQEWRP